LSKKNIKDKDSGKKNKSDEKKNTSLRLDAKVLKALKIRAIEDGTSVQQIVERLVTDYLAIRSAEQDEQQSSDETNRKVDK